MLGDPTSVLLLPRTEVHLWYTFPESLTDPELLSRYHALMTPEERERQQRFRFEKGRHEYLVTRALVRTVLSRYADVAPDVWRFVNNEYGRPAIASPLQSPPLCFNLSHTDGLIVCLVALDREVGVDVENLERPGETVEIADRFFSPIEARALRMLPEEQQRRRFFDYWTLKESYIKARGMGISLPLEQFSFHLDAGCPVRIFFDPRMQDNPRSWQFAQLQVSDGHLIAIAVRRSNEPDLSILVKETIPLVS
ncbi:MAG: 4'-phosphopantetheinyl transferase superfamily protein [Deltaproteobacteria bacterium]|nr:4'-phosphopantetheinyl transferase superfamily protein [Deltaproteobacteria bacterium]